MYVGASSTPVDSPMVSVISAQPDRSSNGSQGLGLSIAPPKFMVPPVSASPTIHTAK